MHAPAFAEVKTKKLAKKKVLDKFYPQYKDMPVQQRVKIDQMVGAKYGGMINKIATKLLTFHPRNQKCLAFWVGECCLD